MASYRKNKVLAEGKTKIIYENSADPKTVYMVFKDDITAGDGAKHDVLQGKALIDWQTNKDIYEFLNRKGVKTHYIESPEERVSIVKKLDNKINLEVVSRRIAAGSILKWGEMQEGDRFDPVITQFHYKDDFLHDPLLDPIFIDYISKYKNSDIFDKLREMNEQIFIILENPFAKFKVQLIDYKLEYGIIEGEVYLIDEITGGSFRLWPYKIESPDLNIKNVLDQLDPKGRLDKDNYRMGGELDEVITKFKAIADITAQFKDL